MVNESDNIIYGPHLERTIFSSLGELLLLLLRGYNEKVLQVDVATGEELPANVLLNKAIVLAKWLQKNNLGPGDCISMSSENRLESSIIIVAAFLAGITFAPINTQYTVGEVTHALNLSKPKLIFCSPISVDKIISGKQNYPYVEKFILLGKTFRKDVIMYEDIIKGAKTDSAEEDFKAAPINPEESVAMIFCSSGTTGLPKGVMITHYNLTSSIEIITKVLERNFGASTEGHAEVAAGLPPFFHAMGFLLLLLAMASGKTLVVYSKFEAKLFLESIAKYKITTLLLPPTILLFLLKQPIVKNYNISSIKEIKIGSAPINKELEIEAKEQLNLKFMSQSYGMTENLAVLIPYEDKNKPGSVGKIVPGMKCKIIDGQGKALGPNQEGELCFQGPLTMKGYINNPEATAETIDEDNWLHTGDVGYYDDDGYFFVVDRIKELIKYKGFQVAPVELEALLMTHPGVEDAAVIGVEDQIAGEVPLAFVVKKSGQDVTSEELEKYVADRVSSPKRLRGGIRFIKEVPRNTIGKITRRVLREIVKNMQL